MIANPERYVGDFADAGADWLGIHVEATVHLERLIQNIKELGAKATVTLNPATPLDHLEYVLPEVDMVLLMTVNPGFSGQKFIRGVLPKVRQLRQRLDQAKLPALIEVDGGVHTDTIREIVAAGADVLVSGSGLFGKHGGYGPGEEEDDARRIAANLRRLRELM
jgi:ribulose-phosphate 3-epimerase